MRGIHTTPHLIQLDRPEAKIRLRLMALYIGKMPRTYDVEVAYKRWLQICTCTSQEN